MKIRSSRIKIRIDEKTERSRSIQYNPHERSRKYLGKLLGLIRHAPVQLCQSLVLVLRVIIEVIVVVTAAASATATSFLQNA